MPWMLPLSGVVVAVVGWLLGPVPLEAGGLARCQVSAVAAASAPRWNLNGAWVGGGSHLLLPDLLTNRIFTYGSDGSPQTTGLFDPAKVAASFQPVSVESHDGQLAIELIGEGLVVLDSRFGKVQQIPLLGRAATTGEQVGFLFGWTWVGDHLLAFGDLSKGEKWRSGLIEVPLDTRRPVRVLRALETTDPARLYFRLGNPYLASINQESYALLAEPKPALYRSSAGRLERVAVLPKPFDVRPELPAFKTPADFTGLMTAVERSVMATHLFATRDALIVVGRIPQGGGTRWVLMRVQPSDGAVLGVVDLGVTANHLTIVPGPEQWAFLAKGPVRALGIQVSERLVLVPTSAIEGIEGGSVLAPSQVLCQ